MNQYNAVFLALVSLAVSSTAFAQGRQMTPAERAQMQQEIHWQKQMKAKADQDAQTSYTQQCKMVAGQLACTGGPAKQNKVVRGSSPTAVKPAATTRTSVPVLDSKVGRAYGNPSVAGQSGYQVQKYTPNNTPKPSQSGPYLGRKYKQY
jgi:hypothetical protein